MKIQQAPNFNPTQLVRTQNQEAPKPGDNNPTPPPPQEKVSIGKEALRTGIAWGNATGTVTGGAVGLATTIGGLYMGVLGGAIVGAALGGGIGPVFGAIGGNGALGFLSTSFQTMGLAAKVGVVLGGAAGAAGSFSVGQKVGEVAGKAVMFVPGAAVGAIGALGKKAEEIATGEGQGTGPVAPQPHQPAKPQDLNKMGGVSKTIAAGIGGFGMLAGAAGGFVAGAGIASTGSLVNGLLAHNVSLANIGGAAAFGGAIGAVGMGVLGAVGGWKLVQAGRWVGDKVQDAVGKKD